MKTRFRVLLSTSLLAPMLFVGIATAIEGSTQTPDKKTLSNDKVVAQANNTEAALTLQQRIDKRKTELKTRLTFLEQKNITTKCKASQQGHVAPLKGRITGIETSRTQVHRELLDRLTKFSEKLKAAGGDTSKLDANIAELQTKIDTFNTDLAAYKQAVSDLSELDCIQDPTGFKASLEAARAAREKVSQDSQAIRTYVKETVKPTLSQIRQQIEEKKDEGATE